MNYKEFIEKNCKTCNNKNTYLCHIVVNENGKLQCVYRETINEEEKNEQLY